MKWQSTKTFGTHLGLSAAFRQHRAPSHCSKLHGYSLGFKFTFESEVLDACNWVVDFGDLRDLRSDLERLFDHKTIVAEDDPHFEWFKEAEKRGIIDMVVTDKAGCEAFAEIAYHLAENHLRNHGFSPRCRVVSVEVFEHGANSALYFPTTEG